VMLFVSAIVILLPFVVKAISVRHSCSFAFAKPLFSAPCLC
jgi:hypothetical protein